MKTIGKLKINPEKIIRNEELMTLKGGYGQPNLICYGGTGPFCEMIDIGCIDAEYFCNRNCEGWTYLVCYWN